MGSKNKIGIFILLIALAIIIVFVASALFTVYLDLNKEIALFKNAPRVESSELVPEYYNRMCWIGGMLKADDPNRLLISRGAGKPCVYYIYRAEYATYETDSDDDVDKTWHLSEEKKEFAGFPLIVQNTGYYLRNNNLLVKGKLVVTMEKEEVRDQTDYRYTESIIPNNTFVWVFGIPDRETIGPADIGLVVLMQTPDAYIADQGTATVFLIIVAVLFFCISGILIGVAVFVIRK